MGEFHRRLNKLAKQIKKGEKQGGQPRLSVIKEVGGWFDEAKKEFGEAFKIVGIAESYEKLLEIHEKWFCGSKQQKT